MIGPLVGFKNYQAVVVLAILKSVALFASDFFSLGRFHHLRGCDWAHGVERCWWKLAYAFVIAVFSVSIFFLQEMANANRHSEIRIARNDMKLAGIRKRQKEEKGKK